MNKNRYIRQEDFNYNHNGYRVWYDGNSITCVNREFVGLYNWIRIDYLTYHIR